MNQPRGDHTMFDIDHLCRGRDMLLNPLRVIGLTLNIGMLAIAGWFLIARMDLPPVQTKAILAALFAIQCLRPLWQHPNQVVGRVLVAQDQLALMGGRQNKDPANVARLIRFDEIENLGKIGFTLTVLKKDGTMDSTLAGRKIDWIEGLIQDRLKAHRAGMEACA